MKSFASFIPLLLFCAVAPSFAWNIPFTSRPSLSSKLEERTGGIADFSSYSYTGNYLINGTVDLELANGSVISLPVTTIFDDDNQRIFSGLVGGGGSFVVLHNASYVFGLPIPGNPCFVNDGAPGGWNYTREIEEYGKAFHYGSYYKLFSKIDQWFGNILDQTTCGGLRLPANFETLDNILLRQTYIYAAYDPVNDVCFRQNSILRNHLISYRTSAEVDFDPYFELPSSCATPSSWCDTFFPSGNPCFA